MGVAACVNVGARLDPSPCSCWEYADTLVMELRDAEGGLETALGAHIRVGSRRSLWTREPTGTAARADLRQGTGMGILGRSDRHRCVEPLRNQGPWGRWVPRPDRQAGAQSPRADTRGCRGPHRVAHSPPLFGTRRRASRSTIVATTVPRPVTEHTFPRSPRSWSTRSTTSGSGNTTFPERKGRPPLWTVFDPEDECWGSSKRRNDSGSTRSARTTSWATRWMNSVWR